MQTIKNQVIHFESTTTTAITTTTTTITILLLLQLLVLLVLLIITAIIIQSTSTLTKDQTGSIIYDILGINFALIGLEEIYK